MLYIVNVGPLINVQDLKNNIPLAFNNLREEQINGASSKEFLKRLDSCVELQGGNYKHFIR